MPASDSPARLCIEVHIRDGKAVFGCAYRSDCYIDTVINCAASVKHFAFDSRIEDINIGGANFDEAAQRSLTIEVREDGRASECAK